MNDDAKDLDHSDQDILGGEISDEALEAAASAAQGAAQSFLGTPTFNFLVACC
jgi:hypothetical protein